uniref:DUF4258 domain-containing protein n=1 Tax=Globodera pallida TaxID=36090 RepID=A0A183CEM7_GLOPA
MASTEKKVRGRPKNALAWTNVTVFLRIFRAKNDFLWSGNDIQWSMEPLAERFGILRIRKNAKVCNLKKKAIGQFAKEFKSAKLKVEAIFMHPENSLTGERKSLQVDVNLPVERGMEYTLILYMVDE